MRKLVQVEDAKSLLETAKDWGVWKWLTEKKRVRETADIAWEAFDELEKDVKSAWSKDLQKAYGALGASPAKSKSAAGGDSRVKATAAKLKEADDEAYRVRMEAERMFDEAEKRMSTSMAREASQVAIDAYNLREKAVRKAEIAGRVK